MNKEVFSLSKAWKLLLQRMKEGPLLWGKVTYFSWHRPSHPWPSSLPPPHSSLSLALHHPSFSGRWPCIGSLSKPFSLLARTAGSIWQFLPLACLVDHITPSYCHPIPFPISKNWTSHQYFDTCSAWLETTCTPFL
jgi:hypothetical protein